MSPKTEDEVEELGKKLDQILDRLRLLEELILEKPEFEGKREELSRRNC